MTPLLVKDIMTAPVVILFAEQTRPLAKDIMRFKHLRHLPVVDDAHHLVGLVSHRDILRAQLSAEPSLISTLAARSTKSSVMRALDQRPVDRAGMRPVETIERLAGAKAGRAGAAREVHGVARSLLEVGELLEGLGGADAALVETGQEGGEGRARLHEATLGAMRDIDRLAAAALRETAKKQRTLVECDLVARVIEADNCER